MEQSESRPRRACVERVEEKARKKIARQELSNMNELFPDEHSDGTGKSPFAKNMGQFFSEDRSLHFDFVSFYAGKYP